MPSQTRFCAGHCTTNVPHFEKYAKCYVEDHRARLCGTGSPLPAVRAAFLPQNELVGSIPVHLDHEGKEHTAIFPLPMDVNYFYDPRYWRRNPRFPPYRPSDEVILEAARLANLVLASPVSEDDLSEETIAYPFGDFSRGVSEEGDACTGEGSVARETYATPREYREDSSGEEELEQGRRRVPWHDPSGIALLYSTADRGRPVNSFAAMREHVPLPVTEQEWRAVFAPF